MFLNNLNNAYEYESERRNDERRAAAESQAWRELGGMRPLRVVPGFAFALVAVLIVLWQVF